MRISDWSSDVCSSDLDLAHRGEYRSAIGVVTDLLDDRWDQRIQCIGGRYGIGVSRRSSVTDTFGDDLDGLGRVILLQIEAYKGRTDRLVDRRAHRDVRIALGERRIAISRRLDCILSNKQQPLAATTDLARIRKS